MEPLMTPRRQRDLARQQAPSAPSVDPSMDPPQADDASGPALTCPNCGTSLSLKAVASGPSPAPPAPPTGPGGPGGSPFGS